MNDLARFQMSDMVECGAVIRKMGENATSMEEVAQRIVEYLHARTSGSGTDARTCALVRFYKTHSLGQLPADLQEFAGSILGPLPRSPEMKCLTLLASAGEKPEWKSRRESVGHKAIPLASEQMVLRFPMISQLLTQMGLAVKQVVKPDPGMIVELQQKLFNVFFVPEARGSPSIPAQEDFVIPHRIRSVLGFGGVLPQGDLIAVILFSKVVISKGVADLFKVLALGTKMAVLPFVNQAVFEKAA